MPVNRKIHTRLFFLHSVVPGGWASLSKSVPQYAQHMKIITKTADWKSCSSSYCGVFSGFQGRQSALRHHHRRLGERQNIVAFQVWQPVAENLRIEASNQMRIPTC